MYLRNISQNINLDHLYSALAYCIYLIFSTLHYTTTGRRRTHPAYLDICFFSGPLMILQKDAIALYTVKCSDLKGTGYLCRAWRCQVPSSFFWSRITTWNNYEKQYEKMVQRMCLIILEGIFLTLCVLTLPAVFNLVS